MGRHGRQRQPSAKRPLHLQAPGGELRGNSQDDADALSRISLYSRQCRFSPQGEAALPFESRVPLPLSFPLIPSFR
ncbi:MAG: hypothetical protein MZV64_28550 [Ignavibacteriales bacterium]|nr:hypothetical protein [Ignavibacteriales bacterium]